MTRTRHLFLVALLVVALPGCAALSRLLGGVLKKPTLAFDHASVKTVSLDGLTLDTVWRVDNPNGFGLDLARFDYGFAVDGHPLAKGSAPNGIHLVADGRAMVTLPLRLRFQDVSATVLDLLHRTDLPYQVKGTFGFDTPMGEVDVPFHHGGKLPLPRLPGVRIVSARVASLSLTGARIDLRVAVSNPNAFPMRIDRFAYQARVAGNGVGGGVAKPGVLPASGAQTIDLPISVSFVSGGRAVYDALQSGRLNLGVKGSLDAGAVHLPLDVSRTVNLKH